MRLGMYLFLLGGKAGNTIFVYAPINVNPEGGGGRAKSGDLINQVVPWVGIWTDFFSKWPEGGDF